MDFGVSIPFTLFEFHVLKVLNVSPSKLHQNSWAFFRGLEILYWGIDITSTTKMFFSFYKTKGYPRVGWYRLFPSSILLCFLLIPPITKIRNTSLFGLKEVPSVYILSLSRMCHIFSLCIGWVTPFLS